MAEAEVLSPSNNGVGSDSLGRDTLIYIDIAYTSFQTELIEYRELGDRSESGLWNTVDLKMTEPSDSLICLRLTHAEF